MGDSNFVMSRVITHVILQLGGKTIEEIKIRSKSCLKVHGNSIVRNVE